MCGTSKHRLLSKLHMEVGTIQDCLLRGNVLEIKKYAMSKFMHHVCKNF